MNRAVRAHAVHPRARPSKRLGLARLACLAAVSALSAVLFAGFPGSPAAADVAGGPVVAKGPYVTGLSDTTATVRVELRAAAALAVEMVAVGGDAGVPRLRFESPAASMHVVRATGLTPGTRYAYTVVAGGGPVGSGHVTTAPAPASSDPGAPHTFIVYGDDRSDDDAHAAVVRAMALVPSDFLVNTGDLVADGGSAANWTTFFDIERDLLRERPLFSAIGNHELYDDAAGANFSRYFGFAGVDGALHPYGTVRVGPVRLFFLNGDDAWGDGAERPWIERALASADGEPGLVWRFAVVHQGPWSAGPHGPNPRLLAARVPELLAAHGVDLVFSGHDHIYERGDAGLLKYVISGGGGAPLYRDIHPTATTRKVEAAHHFIEVTTRGDTFQLVAHRLDGSLLDRCGFTRGGPWDCDPASPAHASANEPAGASAVVTPATASPASPPRSSACLCDAPGSGAGAPFGAWAPWASLVLLLGSVRRYARP
jgi:hypothetical protein